MLTEKVPSLNADGRKEFKCWIFHLEKIGERTVHLTSIKEKKNNSKGKRKRISGTGNLLHSI
jgi:hypothetical protein